MLKDYPELEACYISGIVKKSGSPSRIVEDTVKYHLSQTNPSILVVRTQNDRTVEIIQNNCICSSPIDFPPTVFETEIIENMGLEHPNLDPKTLIIPNYYGSPMIQGGIRRRSKNPRIREATDRLNYEAGDAMIIIGYRGQP